MSFLKLWINTYIVLDYTPAQNIFVSAIVRLKSYIYFITYIYSMNIFNLKEVNFMNIYCVKKKKSRCPNPTL